MDSYVGQLLLTDFQQLTMETIMFSVEKMTLTVSSMRYQIAVRGFSFQKLELNLFQG